MKTTDSAEIVRGASSSHEAGRPGPTRSGKGRKETIVHGIVIAIDSDGVDGSDELAPSFGKGIGRVRATGWISGAADVEWARDKEGQESSCGRVTSGTGKFGDSQSSWGGAGTFRHLS